MTPPRPSLLVLAFTLCAASALAQSRPAGHPPARIAEAVSDHRTFPLTGNVHPLIRPLTRSSAPDPGLRLENLVLTLAASPEQEAGLEELLDRQADPASPDYHRYLTPAEFAARFGAAPEDIAVIAAWLESHGLTVDEIPEGNRAIVFSGFAEQVAGAFGTELRQYSVRGERHLANASDPRIPTALAGVVGGVLKLHDFRHTAFSVRSPEAIPASTEATPAYAPAGVRWIIPGDYHILYNIRPLLNAGFDGTGIAIAVIARSNIFVSDVRTFRSLFSLPANDPQIVLTTKDPGKPAGDVIETTLDTEWAGAVAPRAAVKVIVSASSAAGDGIDLSSLYAVNRNIAPVITVSYGSCEAYMGTTELAFYHSLWRQAAAQGQTVLVSSGDSGAAGCDPAGASTGRQGRGVNGLCSSPYATCVGGTQFVEGSTPSRYWYASSPSSTAATAIGYIPEAVWNESGAAGGTQLWSSGGGASLVYAKPSWQTGLGVPADGRRDVPDVSLTAAAHDGYTVLQGGSPLYLYGVSGTSASAPAFAGIMALINQKMGIPQGNINPSLYTLATRQRSGGAAVFHDVTSGHNAVPGVAGFTAAAGYDLATGLGSVDADTLAGAWNTVSGNAPLTIAASALSVNQGTGGATTVTVTAVGLNAAVNLAVAGAPAGVTATLGAASIASPGSGTTPLTIAAGGSAVPGVYPLTLTATSGGQTATATVTLTITAPTFTLTATAGASPALSFGPTLPFVSQPVNLRTTPANGFNATITFTAPGAPAGITVSFSPATVTGSAAGSSTATVAVASNVAPGSYSLAIQADGGGVTQTLTVRITVVPPSCTLAVTPAAISVAPGGTAALALNCSAVRGTFPAPLAVSFGALPAGLTAQLAPSSLTPGLPATLTLTSAPGSPTGKATMTVTAAGSGFTQTIPLAVTVMPPTFTLTASETALSIKPGGVTTVTVAAALSGPFNAPIALSMVGLPPSVTPAYSLATLPAPGAGTVTITLRATLGAPLGVFLIRASGSGGGVTATAKMTLTIGR